MWLSFFGPPCILLSADLIKIVHHQIVIFRCCQQYPITAQTHIILHHLFLAQEKDFLLTVRKDCGDALSQVKAPSSPTW